VNAPPSTSPSPPSQLALDFDHRPALGGDDFLVATPNAEAVRWLDAWPDWPGPALVIFGPAGSGKTHLAEVFRSKSCARPVGFRGLGNEAAPALMGDARACVLEDAEAAVARRMVGAIADLALEERRNITVPLVRRVLDNF